VPWPDGGPWVLVTTAATVDWQPAAAALAAASTVRSAALVLGSAGEPGPLVLGELATCVRAEAGGADPLSVDEAAALVRTLARTHGLVLVVGVPGLLVPAGRAGWTPLDLAVAVSAPVVVITGTGPDAANHTTLALGAVAGHGLAATVLTVGAPADGDEFADGIPVTPAGHIPIELPEAPDEFATAARTWIDPVLHASAGRPKADTPPPPAPRPPPATVGGKRVVLLLAGVFVSMSLVVCGLAFCQPGPRTQAEVTQIQVTGRQPPIGAVPDTIVTLGPRPAASRPAAPGAAVPGPVPAQPRPVAEVCPPPRGRTVVTEPDPATTRRVNAAWHRIETWLAAEAPAGRRSLRPPAPPKDIAAAQRRMPVAFPADLVASLRRHDGVGDRRTAFAFPPFYDPMPVGRIAGEWQMLCSVLADLSGGPDSSWWDKDFVPFASSGDGGNLLADQRPGSHGRVGRFFNEEGVSFQEWPGSVAELLEQTADSLETGRPFRNAYRPRATDQGVLEWDIV
jgi:cell wall assembly regulator SMI1/dethiobiotin synthetase